MNYDDRVSLTLGHGKVVHTAFRHEGYTPFPECGGGSKLIAAKRYTQTGDRVTCKRCLKLLAAAEKTTAEKAETVGRAEQPVDRFTVIGTATGFAVKDNETGETVDRANSRYACLDAAERLNDWNTRVNRLKAEWPEGTRVVDLDRQVEGTVNGLDYGWVNSPGHINHRRVYLGVDWDPGWNDGGVRARMFTDTLARV